jgi:hypothetical protein
VEETTAAIAAEQEREEAAESLPQSDKSATFESSNQCRSSENMGRSQDLSNDRSKDQGKQLAHSGLDEVYVPLVRLIAKNLTIKLGRSWKIFSSIAVQEFKTIPCSLITSES